MALWGWGLAPCVLTLGCHLRGGRMVQPFPFPTLTPPSPAERPVSPPFKALTSPAHLLSVRSRNPLRGRHHLPLFSELKDDRSFQRVTILSAMPVEQGHVMVTPPGWALGRAPEDMTLRSQE